MKLYISIILLCLGWIHSFTCSGEEKLKLVNPFIGTSPTLKSSNWEGHGRTYPGAVAPFGYIQLTPETRVSSDKGYDYRDKEIFFFSSFGHKSGYPNGSAGNCFIMPIENQSSFQLRKNSRPFSHQNEKAEPGYYKVMFDDNQTLVETTASTRAGMFRFSYKDAICPKIFIGDIGEFELISDSIIKGSLRNVLIEFNTKWSSAEKTNYGIILSFDKLLDGVLLLKLSSSSVSCKNSKENLDSEIPNWNFDHLKHKTQNAWEKQLTVIEISDSSIQNKTKFYTAFYRSLLIPWIVSDVNGSYQGYDGKVYFTKGTDHYDAFSPWDTFRSLHPLLCIVAPLRQNDMILSMLEIYQQTEQLPVQPMTGYHSIPIIVDSYFKNITDFDVSLAYEAMKKCLIDSPFFYNDMSSYILNGYVPSSYPESVTRTVEYAYNDWVLSQYAKIVMSESEDYLQLINRSSNYRNLFDPQQMFLVTRDEMGFVNSNSNFGFKEGDKWNYSFFVPHNPRDIINLMGGDKEFSVLLDNAIRNSHILFDNEPNFHIPYLFNYSKCPSKTQEWISKIRETLFNTNADGLPGNDDLGSMSSWFVFNAMGFYPVCPGVPEYNIGTPLFEKVIIHNQNGNDFVIMGSKKSQGNNYIQKATLNGEVFNKAWFSHATLTQGSKFIFSMDSLPSNWATNPNSAAYSLTETESSIIVDSIYPLEIDVESHELFYVKFILRNRGSDGVKIISVFNDGKELAQKNIFVCEGETVTDSVSCRLYKLGISNLSVADFSKQIEAKVTGSKVNHFQYSQLLLSPIVKTSEVQQFSYLVKNIGSFIDTAITKVYINNALLQSDTVILEPGERSLQNNKIADLQSGIKTLRVDSLVASFKVFEDNIKATLLDIGFQQENKEFMPDSSGLSNHGIIVTTDVRSYNSNDFNSSLYVEIKNNSSFSTLENEITLMGWIKPSKTNQHKMSIITQGDHNVVQLINNHEIEFFAGGWGRGICRTSLPPNFFGKWNHITAVANGLLLKIYINGKLMATTELNNYSPLASKSIWNLGRNVEFPGQRIFYGKIDDVKIFGVALSQIEINKIVKTEKDKFL